MVRLDWTDYLSILSIIGLLGFFVFASVYEHNLCKIYMNTNYFVDFCTEYCLSKNQTYDDYWKSTNYLERTCDVSVCICSARDCDSYELFRGRLISRNCGKRIFRYDVEEVD